MSIKKVWFTDYKAELKTLTLESDKPEEIHSRIKIMDMAYPDNPSEQYPLRHVVQISLLSQDDINILALALDMARTDK